MVSIKNLREAVPKIPEVKFVDMPPNPTVCTVHGATPYATALRFDRLSRYLEKNDVDAVMTVSEGVLPYGISMHMYLLCQAVQKARNVRDVKDIPFYYAKERIVTSTGEAQVLEQAVLQHQQQSGGEITALFVHGPGQINDIEIAIDILAKRYSGEGVKHFLLEVGQDEDISLDGKHGCNIRGYGLLQGTLENIRRLGALFFADPERISVFDYYVKGIYQKYWKWRREEQRYGGVEGRKIMLMGQAIGGMALGSAATGFSLDGWHDIIAEMECDPKTDPLLHRFVYETLVDLTARDNVRLEEEHREFLFDVTGVRYDF